MSQAGRAPRNLGRGSIINIGPVYLHLAYMLSKRVAIGVTKAAALDHDKDGTRINVVCPGSVDTPVIPKDIADILVLAQFIENTVLLGGRMSHAEEIAGIIAFLNGPGDHQSKPRHRQRRNPGCIRPIDVEAASSNASRRKVET